MKQRISFREANQSLSRYIAEVEREQEFVVTRRGRPVALLSPVPKCAEGRSSAQRKAALVRLFSSARPLRIRKWRRAELYDNP